MARHDVTRDAPARPAPTPGGGKGRDPSSFVGKQLGPYDVVAEIARGGMGVVLAARVAEGPRAGQPVALKLVLGDLTPAQRRAFLREARVSSRLHHPHVVRTLDVTELGSELALVMELVAGITFAQLLRQDDVLPDPWLSAWIAASAARGLHAAHELRDDEGRFLALVHRDVSPQNILLGFDGRILVADFGIAKIANDGTSTEQGVLKGKFGYMAPEQVRGEVLDRRTDVFALGAVLFEGLVGERAFDGRGPAEIVAQILHGSVREPRSIRAEVPPSLAAIAMRCLASAPADRFASAAEVADALDEALRAAPVDVEATLAEELARRFAGERRRFGLPSASLAPDEVPFVHAGPGAPSGLEPASLEFAPTESSLPEEATSVLDRGSMSSGTLASRFAPTGAHVVPAAPVEIDVVSGPARSHVAAPSSHGQSPEGRRWVTLGLVALAATLAGGAYLAVRASGADDAGAGEVESKGEPRPQEMAAASTEAAWRAPASASPSASPAPPAVTTASPGASRPVAAPTSSASAARPPSASVPPGRDPASPKASAPPRPAPPAPPAPASVFREW